MPDAVVAFIGLGNMSCPMATNLLKFRKYRVVGFDLSESARESARANGVELAQTAAEAASMADSVLQITFSQCHQLKEVYPQESRSFKGS